MQMTLNNRNHLIIVNVFLIITCCASVVFLLLTIFHETDRFDAEMLMRESKAVELQSVPTLEHVSVYKRDVSSRDLFRPFVFTKKTTAPSQTIDDLMRDYVLAGFVDNNEAILRNRRTRQTIFVREGTRIGEVKVVAITDDKVEVEYKGQRKDMFLR